MPRPQIREPRAGKRCRVCAGALDAEPLVTYRNMPRIAQHLPDRAALKQETGADLAVYQCAYCGLVQIPGAPVPYYRQVIRSSGFSPEMGKFRQRQFQTFVQDHGLVDKKLIEIGCGNGEYLSVMREFCRGSCGLEAAEAAVAHCTAGGLRVTKGFVDAESYQIPGAPYDAFFMMNFLEHLPEPNVALRGIHHNLSQNAVGLIEVPNFNMILDTKCFTDFSTEHLSYFTQETLVRTLEINGFSVVRADAIWHDHIISAVVQKRPPVNLDDFARHQVFLQEAVHDFISRHGVGNVAVWGAGHQALATLALLKLGEQIKYVVDRATFKQGKFTPVTHVPIVAPEMLTTDPAAAVIVMASSYSDEVVAQLKQQYPHVTHIAVLRSSDLEIIT